jgi:hypothetical protein
MRALSADLPAAAFLAVEFGKSALDGKCSARGARGVVLLRYRIAEQRHQAIAKLLGEFAAHLDHLIAAAPAMHSTSSCEPVAPEQPIARMILLSSTNGMPEADFHATILSTRRQPTTMIVALRFFAMKKISIRIVSSIVFRPRRSRPSGGGPSRHQAGSARPQVRAAGGGARMIRPAMMTATHGTGR